MFEFGIIACDEGVEVIDRTMRTEYSQLTAEQMLDYVELDVQLYLMDRMRRQRRMEAQRRRKLMQNPLWKLACVCGLV